MFVLARRPGGATLRERASSAPSRRIDVGPLSLGATRALLSERLGLSLPRHVLRRVLEASVGNPLFALELGRSLLEDGLPGVGEELSVPDSVEELLDVRVAHVGDRKPAATAAAPAVTCLSRAPW